VGVLTHRAGVCIGLLAAAGIGPAVAVATDWDASLDLRLVDANSDRSYLDGGLGGTRWDRDDAAVELGRARLALTQPLGQLWSVHADVSAWDDKGGPAVGVTEAWMLLRPYPFDNLRLRLKSGVFYAPVSLENRASGWESPYTLTFSAIDSWLAAEVRTVGSELQLEWLGTRAGHSFDLAATAAVFGWNETAGVVVAGDGFVFTDRQTLIGGRVGQPGEAPLNAAHPFEQIDGRAGVYGGLELRYLDRLTLRTLRYDNRADPTAVDTASHITAWHTAFTSVGARLETQQGWTAIAQWLDGSTAISPTGFAADWPFHADYLLLSRRSGRHTFSARYDSFRVDFQSAFDQGAQSGHAITAAWLFDVTPHLRLATEWIVVASHSYQREDLYELSPDTARGQVQLSVRYAIGSGIGWR
jgi:hypothetical protein